MAQIGTLSVYSISRLPDYLHPEIELHHHRGGTGADVHIVGYVGQLTQVGVRMLCTNSSAMYADIDTLCAQIGDIISVTDDHGETVSNVILLAVSAIRKTPLYLSSYSYLVTCTITLQVV